MVSIIRIAEEYIQHIGSTLIEGIKAKPIIDIAIVTHTSNDKYHIAITLFISDYKLVDNIFNNDHIN
ncbi:hypothetical protein CS022_21615 [Veronia nyctiphanis]|uniref:Uncharacterized protein n=1 Tax=Veronia nyctiphanis TaxID=1278244 RepID=A0A4Q0YKA4_9GAMM|nr:hypothetical protein CS022_21615 [Veronia nyctiphanis]